MDIASAGDGGEGSLLLALLLLARWSQFASVLVLFGAALFWLAIDGGSDSARAASHRLLQWAAVVAALSGLGWIWAMLANMAGGFGAAAAPETLAMFFTQTQFGPVVVVRLVLLGAAVVVAVWTRPGRLRLSALTLIGALLLIDQAWLGHAAAGGAGLRGGAMIFAYCVHVLAVGAWLGGLPPLVFVLRATRADGGDGARGKCVEVLLRYSVLALAAVILIVMSGAANAGFRSGFSLEDVLAADYGRVLAVKAALVAAMLALACYNRFVALPRLRASGSQDEMAVARLGASVGWELALGLAAVAAAALLGVTPPPQ